MTAAEVQQLGSAATAQAEQELALSRRIEACEWGSGSSVIRGSSFSPQLRLALAAFCYTTRADPQTHVDILGGKPYLNSAYWAEKVASHPHHYNLEQINITDGKEEGYRSLATGAIDRGDRPMALKWGACADQIADLRIQFSPPKGAVAAYATIIRRFIPSAPLGEIEAGRVKNIDQYIVEVREANWVGGNSGNTRKRDPVGMAEPEKTARSRSMRRAARIAYSAYVEQFERFREQATDRLREEWHEVSEPI